MSARIDLHRSSFHDRERPLCEMGEFRISTFKYQSGIDRLPTFVVPAQPAKAITPTPRIRTFRNISRSPLLWFNSHYFLMNAAATQLP